MKKMQKDREAPRRSLLEKAAKRKFQVPQNHLKDLGEINQIQEEIWDRRDRMLLSPMLIQRLLTDLHLNIQSFRLQENLKNITSAKMSSTSSEKQLRKFM